jgi:CheY-like chemotaxis protein
MDELDAIEVCKRIKANPETRGITIVITSGHVTSSLENKAAHAGAVRVVRKPVEPELLIADLGIPPPRYRG